MLERAEVTDVEAVLLGCGVSESTLTDKERSVLDSDGYLLLAEIINGNWLARLRSAFESAIRSSSSESEGPQTGTRNATDLVGFDSAFDGVLTQPKVLSAAYHILGRPFKMVQLGGRDPLPGFGQQGLHSDWPPRASSELFQVVIALWLLDDFTPDNGATRLVPGTHRLCCPVPKGMAAPASSHADQTVITARAGSVLVFNGHLWHSGTLNRSNRPRRVLQCQFVDRKNGRYARSGDAIPEGLSPAARYVFGVGE